MAKDSVLKMQGKATPPASVRDWAREVLDGWGIQVVRDDVILVLSELSNNALTHARALESVRLQFEAPIVRVEVVDGGGGTVAVQPHDTESESGRGLRIVNKVADSWGTEKLGNGLKRVWAEMIENKSTFGSRIARSNLPNLG